ncbi:MAG: M55 family metallopeptidase [Victivallales bacterium]|nr:M55 family metallopeptidase [Victivallales bacterium]
MKVYINTDIEGVAGWVFYASTQGTPANLRHLERMNNLLTDEVDAAVKACFDNGADDVIVNDNHGCAYSIIFERLDPRCRIIHGRAGHFPSWLPLLDESFDAAVGIGMHAMAGTPAAVCPHSYWHMALGDGTEVALSECSMFAALAGEKGVPLVAISGDNKIAEEITSKIPECETAVVKEGLAPQNACSLIPKRACELITEKVALGLNSRTEIAPFKLEGPYKLNVSNRNPEIKELENDMEGDDLWALMHDTCAVFGNKWGDQSIDDRSWRYPDEVFA